MCPNKMRLKCCKAFLLAIVFIMAITKPTVADEDDGDNKGGGGRGKKCMCPAPDNRNLTIIPNSSKVCGYELIHFPFPGNAENCKLETVYKCRIVALDEEAPAKHIQDCVAPEGYCRGLNPKDLVRLNKRLDDPSSRICSEHSE